MIAVIFEAAPIGQQSSQGVAGAEERGDPGADRGVISNGRATVPW